MQTEADPLAIQLADERALHDASQSRLKCLSREVEQAQADYSVLHQMLTAKQAELLSATQRVQALETERVEHRALMQAQRLELQDLRERIEQLTQCLQQNAHAHAEALQYKQQSARFEQQAKDSTAALQDFMAEKQRLTDIIAKTAADHAALQQQQASQLSSLSAELSAAQQRLADFDKACCTLHSLIVPSAAAAALDKASAMSPDSLVQLVTNLHEGAKAVEVQMEEQLIALTIAHATEAQLLRSQLSHAQPDNQNELLRQSLETELQEHVTQLEANSNMEVEMLEQQLAASQKESTALRQRLAAANAAMSAANINPANPALTRVMQEGGVKVGPHRGAGGTPHALALAWARAEAARLSPATVLVSPVVYVLYGTAQRATAKLVLFITCHVMHGLQLNLLQYSFLCLIVIATPVSV
ncbi:MAG: hypothetical protein LQ350_002458 [Teloschistes chrysophthalmus]|nr:MAG: hypothetical protein LQ350_002458 [Niorma chrysophthalma]